MTVGDSGRDARQPAFSAWHFRPGDRAGERAIGEQPYVDQRNRQRDLSSAEERQRRGADNTDHRDVDAKKPVGGTFLDGSHGPA
jgi:hypothetical protein